MATTIDDDGPMRLGFGLLIMFGLVACRPHVASTPPSLRETNTPAPTPRNDRVAEVVAGHKLTCARMFDGSVRCWGLIFRGTEDAPRYEQTLVPTPRPDFGVAARITIAGDVVCMWAPDGRTRCTGGSPWLVPRSLVTGVFTDVAEVSGRGGSYCMRRHGAAPQCTGQNTFGQLGVAERGRPVQEFVVPQALEPVAQIVCGDNHICARTFDGAGLCWGSEDRGYRYGMASLTRIQAEGIVDLDAGAHLVCAILGDTSLRCSLLDPDNIRVDRLQPVGGLTGVADVGIGVAHACVLLHNGTVRCWGSDAFGQLGDGPDDDKRPWCRSHESGHPEYCRSEPVEVAGLRDAVALAVGSAHTCVLTRAHTVRCWGHNEGELGDGTKQHRDAPIEPLWAGKP